ncbi:hypothetical protein ACFUNF_10460 [Streptomyces sp. NPDC057291]
MVRIDDDSSGAFFAKPARRYGMKLDGPPPDVADRIVHVVKPTSVSCQ